LSGRVLFLTQWFEPEPAFKGVKFAKALSEKGFEVEVATGLPNYPSGRIAPGYRPKPYHREVREGIVVHRLPLYPSHSQSSIGRIFNYLSFFVSALLFLLVRARCYDAIYVYHPPITVGLAAALAGIVWRRPFILDVQDLWPDTIAASGMAGTDRMSRLLTPVCRFVYRRAAMVVGQSQRMTTLIVERGAARESAATIYNWADETHAYPRPHSSTSVDIEAKFNVVFAGNIGRVQGLGAVVRAAHLAARSAPKVQLTLIGDGIERDNIADLIKELDINNVTLLPGVPVSEIGNILADADIMVIHLADNPLFEVTVPSKTQFYMAMGKPILIGVRGEAAEIVEQARAGIATAPEDVDALAQAMVDMSRMTRTELEQLGRNARSAYEARFSFGAAMVSTAAIISKIIAVRS